MPFSPNPDLLVTSDALEEVLFDKATGLPLSGGIVTFYEDGTNILKNIYEQNGVDGGPYTYSILPNPMTLNADGSTSDSDGNNVKIYYYPYEEGVLPLTAQLYYVTVYNSAGTLQFTRSNFPFGAIPITPTPGTTENAVNQIVNGRFWRNIAIAPASVDVSAPSNTISINGITNYYTTLAPSQHDGFAMPDIIYITNGTASAASDTIKFGQFPQDTAPVLANDITPEYYLDFSCVVTGSDTYKYIQIPISLHLLTLGSQPDCTVTFQAKAISGSSPTIGVNILPFAGTGATTPATVNWQTFAITSSWEKYTVTQTMPPSITESLLGAGADDGFYLQLSLPAGTGGNAICEIQIALPSFYITATVPTNDFETYDAIGAIIDSPRTGDIRQSMNNFFPFGWVPLNNGTIGSTASAASTRAASDTWPLYNLLYNNVNQAFVPVSGYTGNAYNDFSANRAMMLTSAFGMVLMGLPPVTAVTSYTVTAPSWNTSFNGFFTLPSNALLYPGSPVILTGTSLNAAFTSGTLYYAIPALNGSGTPNQFQLATTYANAIAGTAIVASGAATGTSISLQFALGGNFGQDEHVQLQSELPATLSNFSLQGTVLSTPNTGTSFSGLGSPSGTPVTTKSTAFGSGYPFNIVQPSLYVNVFLKL